MNIKLKRKKEKKKKQEFKKNRIWIGLLKRIIYKIKFNFQKIKQK